MAQLQKRIAMPQKAPPTASVKRTQLLSAMGMTLAQVLSLYQGVELIKAQLV